MQDRSRNNRLQVNPKRLWSRVQQLAALTEKDQPWTRRAFTDCYDRSRDWLRKEMENLNLAVSTDAAGNLVGNLPGSEPNLASLASGSHTDTVPRGGRFDGIAGVVAALEVASVLAENPPGLKRSFEVIDFLAEEPNAYGTSCIGSRGMAGKLLPEQLDYAAHDGSTLAQAIARMGGRPESLNAPLRAPRDLAGFVELHIEQGVVLEQEKTDIGIVTDIVGITRYNLSLKGRAMHSGTTPMDRRHDALAGAAEFVVAVEKLAREHTPGAAYLVATVGQLNVIPNGSNVVPGRVDLVLEARSNCDRTAELFCREAVNTAKALAARRSLSVECRLVSESGAVSCDEKIQSAIERAAASKGCKTLRMPSGAGHDAAYMGSLCPAGMVFIPCREGRSHCPEEWVETGQLACGAQVLLDSIVELDRITD